MNQIQELNAQAKEYIERCGYSIIVNLFKGWNRSEELPDHVNLAILKNEELIFQIEFRAQFEGDVYDAFGDNTIAECLALQRSEDYQRRLEDLNQKMRMLQNLQSRINIFHKKEEKLLAVECQNLAIWKKAFIPFAIDGIYANIPLIEESVGELNQLYDDLTAMRMVSSKEKKEGKKGELGEE